MYISRVSVGDVGNRDIGAHNRNAQEGSGRRVGDRVADTLSGIIPLEVGAYNPGALTGEISRQAQLLKGRLQVTRVDRLEILVGCSVFAEWLELCEFLER